MTTLSLTPQQISVSLENKDGELRLDSRIIAQGFGVKSHKDYRHDTLEKYQDKFAELGVVYSHPSENGEIVWYLNQAQVNFAGTLARNTEKAVNFKLNLVKAFEIAKSIAHPVSVPAILPEVRAVQIANSIRHITDTLDDNPRLAQLLIDLSISGIVEKTNLLNGAETPQLRGVAEIAAEMKLPVNIKNRGDLGKFVVAAGFTPKTEKRLVNGAMRDVNCYPDTPELRQSIEQFFN
jgi:hypothetical protein